MAGMRVGSILLGSVKKMDGESIKTKFLMIGVPLIPLGSYYVTKDEGTVKVKLNWASVLAGYMRFVGAVSSMILLMIGLITWIKKNDPNPQLGAWLMAFGMFLLMMSLVSVFTMGKEKPGMLRERRILKDITGMGLHPSMLPRKDVKQLFEGMRQSLAEEGLPNQPDHLEGMEFDAAHAPMVYAAALYGEYALRGNAWAKIESSLKSHLGGRKS